MGKVVQESSVATEWQTVNSYKPVIDSSKPVLRRLSNASLFVDHVDITPAIYNSL